ncbi:hypothetical protein E4U21_007239 [Claviceps maximensis]|nr:hypothetical protein E4U21_007239 [Claviceps maximensis]
MPEIAEVARIVHFLRLHLVGKKIKNASAIDDANVFGKVGTTGAAVEAALRDKKDNIRQTTPSGHAFWDDRCVTVQFLQSWHILTSAGWVHIRGAKTAYTNYYKKLKESDLVQWPPKFWKFHLTTHGKSATEVAFTDARRFGRVRLVDCPGADIRQHSPLKENGPDPVIDTERFTEDYLRGKMKARHVPIKALLLDQAMISGIGNWVADETLYQAKLHPEQYSDTFTDLEIQRLFESVRYVCQTAVDKLGDSDEFPSHWLFDHRWGKGDKGAARKLPNGEAISFITVGGRTSCFAPGVQKKTGQAVPATSAAPIKAEQERADQDEVDEKDDHGDEENSGTAKRRRNQKIKVEGANLDESLAKRRRTSKVKPDKDAEAEPNPGSDITLRRRRSARLRV